MPYILAVLCGGLLVFSYAPFNLWLIAPLALIVVIRQWQRVQQHSFLLGWLFGLGWFGAGISWVHVSIAEFGGVPLVASIAMMALLCAYLALFPALALSACQRFVPTSVMPLGLALTWFIAEYLRSIMLTGFPWLGLGYTQFMSPLAGWLPIIGETGVSSLLLLLCASIAQWRPSIQRLRHGPGTLLMVSVSVVSGLVLNTVSWTQPHQQHTITMVQGNIEQSMRWRPELDAPIMQKYLDLSEFELGSDIIIWPEVAIPQLEPVARGYLENLDVQSSLNHSALITGIVNYNFESEEAFNSLIVLGNKNPEDEAGHYRYWHNNRYSKHHLLPIGEFVPFEDILRPLAPLFDLPMSSFSRGDYQQVNLLANGIKVAPAICFEIAFPRQIRNNLIHDTDLILTVSNDAWFGHSHGPAQHLQLAQMRAKEFGIPVARATNNGITAFIDEHGDITSRLPQFETATLTDQVISTRGTTPYRELGDLPIWLIILVSGIYLAKSLFLKKFKKMA